WGKPYDWPGLIRTQVFKLRAGPAWKRRWFCSEIVAHALGLPDPWQFSPGSLFERVSQMNAACTKLTAIKAANLRPVAASEPEAFQ
nr:hypothetical protein [Hyphomonadaceae bacterium]